MKTKVKNVYSVFEKPISYFSDTDLISMVIGNISPDINIDLSNLYSMSLEELKTIFSPAKASKLYASFELGRRRQIYTKNIVKITSSKSIFHLMSPILIDVKHEEFWVIFLNRNNRIVKVKKMSHGGLVAVVVDNRLIIKEALLCNVSALILCHNHPSGNMQPSDNDKKITYDLNNCSKLFDIPVLDHIIISGNTYYSFSDEGII